VNVVFFLLGDSPESEFRRREITQKKEYNKPSINNSVQEGLYSGKRSAEFFLLNSQYYGTA
jgi:hypothetical protein